MSGLTKHMRAALENARRGPLRRIHTPGPGRPPWPAHPSTLMALLRQGLVDHEVIKGNDGCWREAWTINDAGREALKPRDTTRRDSPMYLVRCGSTRFKKLPNGRWAVADSA